MAEAAAGPDVPTVRPHIGTRYRAFISYSWQDKVWARRLQRWLENYEVPADVPVDLGPSRRLGKIFRDDEDMAASGDIGSVVRGALDASDCMIVVCSPRSAHSRWVPSEIEQFRTRHPDGQIFAVIIDGEPNASDPARECFPAPLRASYPSQGMPIEPVGVDVRRDGRARVCARLAAGMLGVDFDDLWHRDRRRAERVHRLRLLALGALTVTFAALLVMAVVNANKAHLALSRIFAERAWQKQQLGDPLAASRYALAGYQLVPQNEPLYLAALGAIVQDNHESLPPLVHGDEITTAFFTPDGLLAVTASRDRFVKVWNARSGMLVARLGPHASAVTAAAASADSRFIVTGDDGGHIRLWSGSGWRDVRAFDGQRAGLLSVAFLGSGHRVLCFDKMQAVFVMDVDTGAVVTVSPAVSQRDLVWSVAASPDGRRIAIARDDGEVHVHDAGTGAQLHRLRGSGKAVWHVAFSVDGSRIVASGSDGTATVWDSASGAPVTTLEGHKLALYHAEFSPDGRRVVTASADRTARVWDAKSGALAATLGRHSSMVTTASYSLKGQSIMTAGDDGSARIWDAGTGTLLDVLRGHDDSVSAARLSGDGTLALTASVDGTARLWPLTQRRLLATVPSRDGGFSSVEFSPDGTRIIAATQDGSVIEWDAKSLAEVSRVRAHHDGVSVASYSQDGGRVFTAGGDGLLRIWTSRPLRALTFIDGGAGPVLSAALSPDRRFVALSYESGVVQIRDVASGALTRTLSGHAGEVRSVAFSHDGGLLASSGQDKTVTIWRVATGEAVKTLRGHKQGVGGVVFSNDDSRLLTTSDDETARVWDARKFTLQATLSGHDGFVFSGAFSRDGRRIATASEDGSAKIWDAAEGRLLATFGGHRGDVYGVALSPDGTRLLTAGEDGMMRVWDVRALTEPWAPLARQACVSLLGDKARRFSAAEVASDPLLADEWGRADRDVCAGLSPAAPEGAPGR